MQKFWETEELPQYEHKDPEAVACENHFVKTHERDSLGRYVLKLPFKDLDSINLGSNREIALKRLHSLDKKLSKDPEYKKMYDENLKSYLEPGHMTIAKKSVDYLLIHFGIYKETSSTTKLRCVYDPNIESDIGNSLAKCLMVGPKLQKDIADLLTVFRLNPVAYSVIYKQCIGPFGYIQMTGSTNIYSGMKILHTWSGNLNSVR